MTRQSIQNMWTHLQTLGRALKAPTANLLAISNQNVFQQFRTTFILKRRWPPGLHKKGQVRSKPLKSRHFVYDLVEHTNARKPKELEVILIEYVKGIGNPGDIVKMKEDDIYHNLLLPGFAVYASKENIEKYSKSKELEEKFRFSSPYVQDTMKYLSSINLVVLMNKEVAWTVQPWHIRSSFRQAGIHVPEDAIKLPEEAISGPNLDLEGKYFEVTVTINNKETVPVKCRIHHWSTTLSEKLLPVDNNPEVALLPIFSEKTASTTEQ